MPHASVQVDCTALVRLRDEVITPFVLTLRLLVIALTHNKILNSTWVDGPDGPQVHSHHAIHLGFAVAAPRGLLVPVVTDAQDKTTRELAECVARLIREARAGTLKPAELAGSTFTVSNFGALGLDDGVPVINHPEAAILGMGSLKPRPMVLDDAVVDTSADDPDLCVRPPGRRRRQRWAVFGRAAPADRIAGDGAARSVAVGAARPVAVGAVNSKSPGAHRRT